MRTNQRPRKPAAGENWGQHLRVSALIVPHVLFRAFRVPAMGNGALLGLHPNTGTNDPYNPYDLKYDLQSEEPQDSDNSETKHDEIAPGISIRGALGDFARNINADFIRTGEVYNDHELYRSMSSQHDWLRYTPGGRWMVSSTQDKNSNSSAGFCCSKDVGLFDPSCAKGWLVVGSQHVFRTQAMVKATRMKSGDIFDQRQTVEDSFPKKIHFQGASGSRGHDINGVYTCETTEEKFVEDNLAETKFYRQENHPSTYCSTLAYDSSGRWVVLRGSHLLAYCALTGLANPCYSTRWYVSSTKRLYSVQPLVTVMPVETKTVSTTQDESDTCAMSKSAMSKSASGPASKNPHSMI